MEYRITLAVDRCTTLTLKFLAASWWKIHLHFVEFLFAIFARFHVRLYIPSVRRCLKSPRFVLYLHTILFVARHVIESLLHKWEETSLNISEKFVPQTAHLSSEDNKYTAELSFGSSRNTISWKGLLTSTEIRIKLFTRRRILSADINLRSGSILAVLIHSL